MDVRPVIAAWLAWMVAHQFEIGYTEGPARLSGIGAPGKAFDGDCSSSPLNGWNWTGCPDPTKANPMYSAVDTETWAAAGHEMPLAATIDVDAVIYGLGGPLSAQHMAIIVRDAGTADPLTVSHGWSGEPAYVRLAVGDPTGGAYGPPRFFRYPTSSMSGAPIAVPPGYKAPVAAGTAASKVPARFRPTGTPPTLERNVANDERWVIYLRLCLRAAECWPQAWPVSPGGYGTRTEDAVMRFERVNGLAPDGEVTPRVWLALGVQ